MSAENETAAARPTSPDKDEQAVRDAVLLAAKEMVRSGLVEGTSGNLSGRLADGRVILTPSTLGYDVMTTDDLVLTDIDGNVLAGERAPTSEKGFRGRGPARRAP